MSNRYRSYLTLVACFLFIPRVVVLAVAQEITEPPVKWQEPKDAVTHLKKDLASGDPGPAQMRVLQMQLTAAGSARGLEFELRILERERRPDPEERDASLSRFLPAADGLQVLAKDMQRLIAGLLAKQAFVNEYALDNYLVNDALGRSAFLNGNYQSAADYLQKAADIFLKTCRARFWVHHYEKADQWIADLQSGNTPDLSPNSLVGLDI